MVKSAGSSLGKRVLSGLILGPAFLLIVWISGSPGVWAKVPFIVTAVIAGLISINEWYRMARLGGRQVTDMLIGVPYIIVAVAAFIDLGLRRHHGGGLSLVLVLLLTVWASDIGAYMTGKTIGGPKLWPSVSPNKTWAGLGGAMFFSGLTLGALVYFGTRSIVDSSIAFGAGLAFGVLGQAGDLFISAFKRRAGLKDTGALIPGHGGLLDRIDSLLLVAPAYLLAYVLWL